MQYVFGSIGTQLNDQWRKKTGIISNIFFLPFSFLNPKVNNSDNNHRCPLRNQNDILDNPIHCKLNNEILNAGMIQNILHNTNLNTPTM